MRELEESHTLWTCLSNTQLSGPSLCPWRVLLINDIHWNSAFGDFAILAKGRIVRFDGLGAIKKG